VSITVRELAEWVQGTLRGDGSVPIQAARPIHEAGPGHITFLDSDKHAKQLAHSRAAAVIARPGMALNGRTVIEVDDPLAAFLTVYQRLHGRPDPPRCGIDPRACIDPTVRLGADPSVHPFVCIGAGTVIGDRCRLYPGVVIGRDCRLGDDVTLYPHAVLYDGCVLGNRVTVHAHAVLGADGFGYRLQGGRHVKVPQLGSVEVGDDVEIGAGTTIDRGTFQATRVGEGTKIDNLVMIGHNCAIGRHNLLVSQVGIAGSTSTGEYVVMAGQAGVVDHVHIGDHAVVGAQAGVTRDVPAGQRVLGAPARPEREVKVMVLSLERLPDLLRDMKQVKKRLGMT
jgi:UDP-3-O-[3-hydroxymyristoyl] glucosamine N-acyltransferase